MFLETFILCATFLAGECDIDSITDDTIAEVTTQFGVLQGTKEYTLDGKGPVYTFRGVRYAKPPVATLRYAKPQPLDIPVEPSLNPIDATQFGAICPQDISFVHLFFYPFDIAKDYQMSEDCLFVNIYSPSLDDSLPVFVWFHGGGFTTGAGAYYEGTALAAMENIVVVTLNYRLGAFGFLSFGDDRVPANLGLRDQQLALQWVKQNIAPFGGDPEKVTIGGQSAGGHSTSYHLVTPSSRGLFNRAIVESGSALVRCTSDVIRNSNNFAASNGCPSNSTDVLSCLQGLDWKVAQKIAFFSPETVILCPYPDGDLLPADLNTNFISYINPVNIIAGVTTHEGFYLASGKFPDFFSPEFSYESFLQNLRNFLNFQFGAAGAGLVDGVLAAYDATQAPTNADDLKNLRLTVLKILSDFSYHAPSYRIAKLQSEVANKVFYYNFDRDPRIPLLPSLLPSSMTDISNHEAELLYTWGFPFYHSTNVSASLGGYSVPLEMTEADLPLTRIALRYWANFIRNGDPNGDGVPHWPQFYGQSEEFVNFRRAPYFKQLPRFEVYQGVNYPTSQLQYLIQDIPGYCANSSELCNGVAHYYLPLDN